MPASKFARGLRRFTHYDIAIVVRLGESRLQFDRFIVTSQSSFALPQIAQCIAEQIVRLGELRPQPDCRLITDNRLVRSPQRKQHVAVVVMRLCEVRPQRDRLRIDQRSRFRAANPGKHAAKRVVGRRRTRPGNDCLAKPLDRLTHLPGLERNNSRQMQCTEMRWLSLQNLAAQRRCVSQRTLPIKRLSLPKPAAGASAGQ